MEKFEGSIPKTSETTDIIYSNPYQPPNYKFDDFEIDFNDFPIEVQNNNDSISDQSSSKKDEIETKISKVQELKKLKTLENICHHITKMIDEKVSLKKEETFIKTSIIELGSYATDLCYILLNYDKENQDRVFNELKRIICKDELNITEDNDDLRCNEIAEILSSLEPDTE